MIELPNGIDPQKRLCDLTQSELETIAGAVLGSKRWQDTSDYSRSQHGKMMAAARMERLTPEQRQDIARKAGVASAAARQRRPTKKPATSPAGPTVATEES